MTLESLVNEYHQDNAELEALNESKVAKQSELDALQQDTQADPTKQATKAETLIADIAKADFSIGLYAKRQKERVQAIVVAMEPAEMEARKADNNRTREHRSRGSELAESDAVKDAVKKILAICYLKDTRLEYVLSEIKLSDASMYFHSETKEAAEELGLVLPLAKDPDELVNAKQIVRYEQQQAQRASHDNFFGI